jgi:hypothetical protein
VFAGIPARRVLAGLASLAGLALALPATTLAHQLSGRYEAPLPLVIYIGGAALAVAMSFLFVTLRNSPPAEEPPLNEPRVVPAWLRALFGAMGLLAWVWIVAQTIVGGSGDGDVASLFLWVYGWVGLALVSALIGPAWAWIDPFSTLHRVLSWVGGRIGFGGTEPADYPDRLGIWPAVAGFAAVIWIELVGRIEGGRSLGLLFIAYTFITLAGMSYFGRSAWRRNAEIFSVWFGLLGRLAPFALVGEPDDGKVRTRSFGSGLLYGTWSRAQLVMITLGTGAIIFDGLSQTQLYFDLFGGIDLFDLPALRDTVIAVLFLGGLVGVVLLVARRLSVGALAAGLLPVAVGYLIAHYLTYLLVDGQRIIAALNDPLLRGDNLLPFDLGFYQPTLFLPPAFVWSLQLAAVVGGHIVGAWAGHAVLAEGRAPEPARQLPLAALMVVLTSVTLWSLGQSVLSAPPASG